MADGNTTLDADRIIEELDQTLGRQIIEFKTVELCTRVTGFGVYDPIPSNTFVRGRENKMILYAELDNFRAVLGDDDYYEVQLTQQVSLYDDRGGDNEQFNRNRGLEVWRQPEAQILDRSRNRRRDFFVVQLIKLPQTLSVGRYRLKVHIRDVLGECVNETTVPINIVADDSVTARR